MTYVSTVNADSPAAFWECQDTSGSLTDSTGAGHTASVAGSGMSYSVQGPGPYNAVRLIGNSQSGWQAADNDVWSSRDFTLEAWIKPNSGIGGATQYWMMKHYNGFVGEWWTTLDFDGTNLATTAVVAKPDLWDAHLNTTTSTTTEPHCGWHHLVVTMDDTAHVLKSYIDGVLVDTDSTPTGSHSTNVSGVLAIGHHPGRVNSGGNVYSVSGDMAMVAFYDHALSAARIAAHFKAMPYTWCPNPNPGGWTVGYVGW